MEEVRAGTSLAQQHGTFGAGPGGGGRGSGRSGVVRGGQRGSAAAPRQLSFGRDGPGRFSSLARTTMQAVEELVRLGFLSAGGVVLRERFTKDGCEWNLLRHDDGRLQILCGGSEAATIMGFREGKWCVLFMRAPRPTLGLHDGARALMPDVTCAHRVLKSDKGLGGLNLNTVAVSIPTQGQPKACLTNRQTGSVHRK